MTEALFVLGSGGVGKTTLAGALASAAAERGLTTLVVTVDPARRLAQALGLTGLGNDPVLVPDSEHLHAAMLDAAASWEALVRRHTDRATADRLVHNRFFRAIADRFPAGQAYAVAEETARLVDSGEFDVIVVDTPPVGGGVDFFDAPDRIRMLVAGRTLRLLTGPPIPGRRLLFSVTAKPTLRLADRMLGGPLLTDVGDFLIDLRTTYDGIRHRARQVQALLDRSDRIVVATPDPGPVAAARALTERHPMRVRAIVANRVVPAAWADAAALGGDAASMNMIRWAAEARRHRDVCAELAATGLPVIEVPWITPEPTTLGEVAGLAEQAGLQHLFS